jgi:DNA-binding transcriptional LysR family regulator
MYGDDAGSLSQREMLIFSIMLRERSLTRVAYALDTTQPTVSKVLARLRVFFRDPLFVRVGARMHPTPKALRLSEKVRRLLSDLEDLAGDADSFEPRTSRREFRLLVTDVGMIRLLPAILRQMQSAGAGMRLLAVPMDSRRLEEMLESGEADIALGAFPRASRSLRRQRLYSDSYVCVARGSHPRLAAARSLAGFVAERHAMISASAAGHGVHEVIARALELHVPAANICLRVPSFPAIAAVVMQTDTLGIMPSQLAMMIAARVGMATFPAPLSLPKIEIGHFWHERFQHDAGHKWLRELMATLFRGCGASGTMDQQWP